MLRAQAGLVWIDLRKALLETLTGTLLKRLILNYVSVLLASDEAG